MIQRLVVTALLSVVGAACADTSSTSTTASAPTVDITLSNDHPDGCVHVGETAQVAEFGVTVVENPDQQNLELDVLAESGQIVTVFGVYPPTTPQRFRIRLSAGDYTIRLQSSVSQIAGGTSVNVELDGATVC